SVTALAAAFVLAFSLWPDNHAPKMINHAAADSADKKPVEPTVSSAQANIDKLVKAIQEQTDDLNAKIEAEMKHLTSLEFTGQPLNEVFDYIVDKHSIMQIVSTTGR